MKRRMKTLFKLVILVCLLMLISCDDGKTTKPRQVTDPVFSHSGGVYNTVLHIEILSSTEGAEINYTLDGSEPTESSRLYTESITITSSKTLKARAFKDNDQPSNIVSTNYWVSLTPVATPTFTPAPGDYPEEQVVTIDCATPEAVIYYTIDGSEPTDSSTVFTSPLEVISNTTIKARAFKTYYPASEIGIGEFEINIPSVAVPILNPPPGIYSEAQSISLFCDTLGAVIYYTVDGSQPSSSSLVYDSPFIISTTTTVRAFAVKDNCLPSRVISGIYEINNQAVSTPTFSPESGYYYDQQWIRIYSSTPEATLYYTLDGSEPTESSLVFTNTIIVNSSITIKARGFRDNYLPSEIGEGHYYVSSNLALSPVFDPPAGYYIGEQVVSLTSDTPGAIIFYTTDGSEPSENSDVYIYPINISSTTTIKARAYETDHFPSEVVEGTFYIGSPIPENFVMVEGGLFSNGTANVILSSFYMDKYEVTQADYEAVMGTNPSYNNGVGEDYPVYNVSWYDAILYCNAKSIEEDLSPCYDITDWSCDFGASGYRLPTEMEWMYAAKGGNQTHVVGYGLWAGTNQLAELPNYAWYDLSSANTSYPVGTKLPNELGIYDMSGNILEWCWDRWEVGYPNYLQTDPVGPDSGQHRVARGGTWMGDQDYCEVRKRINISPYDDLVYLGFRIVQRARN